MAKKVRALSDGFYGGALRYAGDVFEVSDTTKIGKWMQELETPEFHAPVASKKQPAGKQLPAEKHADEQLPAEKQADEQEPLV